MCSDHEGFPYAQLEAMASGLPSVVTRTGDLGLMVDHGKNGYVIERGDLDGLVTALSKLVSEPETRRCFGENARLKTMQEYNSSELSIKTLNQIVGT